MATNAVEFGSIPAYLPPLPIQPIEEWIQPAPKSEATNNKPAPDPNLPTRDDCDSELWPLIGTSETDLRKRGMTEAGCVIQYQYGTTDERLDALIHLARICKNKVFDKRGFWNPKPGVIFKGTGTEYYAWSSNVTSKHDWEQSNARQPGVKEKATLGWFRVALVEYLERYSSAYVTRRELLELARIKDWNLLHVCTIVVRDMFNAAEKQNLHEIATTSLVTHDGDTYYTDQQREMTVQPSGSDSQTLQIAVQPNYEHAVHELVENKSLRTALPKQVRTTLEYLFRTLESGADAQNIIHIVADKLNRDPRSIRRHLQEARRLLSENARASSDLVFFLWGLDLSSPHYGVPKPARATLSRIDGAESGGVTAN